MTKHIPPIKEIKFSIITLCFRGADHLPRLYESLKTLAMKKPCFEWIIVDDFSDDGGATASVIRKITNDNILEVKSIFLSENHCGSKSAAEGAKIATGEYTIILDQDDELTGDALETYQLFINKYSDQIDFAGVCGRCVNSDGTLIGQLFKSEEIYANEPWIRHVKKYRGEFFQCTKTNLIRKYFAEMMPGYTNGYAWGRIAQQYSYVYINSVVRLYNTSNPSSLSNNRKIMFVGNHYKQQAWYLNENLNYLIWDPLQLLRLSLHCERYKIHAMSFGTAALPMDKMLLRIIFAIVHPVAYVVAKIDKSKERVFCARP